MAAKVQQKSYAKPAFSTSSERSFSSSSTSDLCYSTDYSISNDNNCNNNNYYKSRNYTGSNNNNNNNIGSRSQTTSSSCPDRNEQRSSNLKHGSSADCSSSLQTAKCSGDRQNIRCRSFKQQQQQRQEENSVDQDGGRIKDESEEGTQEDDEEEVWDNEDYIDTLDDDDNPYACFDQTFDYSVTDASNENELNNNGLNYINGDDDNKPACTELTVPLKFDVAVRKNSNESARIVLKRKPERDVSRYDKICTLGVGTFGRVTLVRLKSTVQYYALKTMPMKTVVENEQEEHVFSERRILELINHPFIIRLYWAYKDDKFLYMLFDYLPGGELFSYLKCEGHFSVETTQFYSSEILLALEYLHSKSIVYRDLKPENLLLNAQGHVVLVDLGFAKVLHDRTWTLCGTAEYLAPEIIERKGHNKAVDFWAFGILLYEMLVGRPPFRAETTFLTYEKILACKLKFPKRFYATAKDLIKNLLVVDRTKRLGNKKGSADDVKGHPWFRNVNWDDMYDRKVKPPIVPRIHYEGDSGNYDEYDEESQQRQQRFDDTLAPSQWELEKFKDW